MTKTTVRDSEPAAAALKKDLRCWELCPNTGQRVLRQYSAGDPVPKHLTDAQRDNLAAQGVI